MPRGKAGKLQQRSPAEFFAENKNIAGFDNPGKSLYTTIRELVENGLDACEQVPQLPSIVVEVSEMSKETFNEQNSVSLHSRVDETMYRDHESEKDRKKREAKEKKEAAKEAKAAAKGGGGGDKPAPKKKRGSTVGYFTVTVRDNGCGMKHDDIPKMLGTVLSGTKYGVRQARGKFGLGSKMALIWSKQSTGLPVNIKSCEKGKKNVSFCELDIDIIENKPNVLDQHTEPNEANWHGTEVKVTIEGNWTTYKAKIIQYMRLMAVITPYADFSFQFSSIKRDKDMKMRFRRRSDMMPAYPMESKYHPSSIDLETLKQLHHNSRQKTLAKFLEKDFESIEKSMSIKIAGELRLDPEMPLKELDTGKQLQQIKQLFDAMNFPKPDGSYLSPAGEYNLMLGIQKQMDPEFVATHQEKVGVFEGHAFIVEVGVCIGSSKIKKPGITLFRYANRIPMLFEAGADVTMNVAKGMKWGTYKINKATDKIGIFSSIVSTKIPFKGTSKEYIGADATEIHGAIKKAVTACASSLKQKITRRKTLKEKADRKRNLEKYVSDVTNSLWSVLESEAGEEGGATAEPPSKRARTADDDDDEHDDDDDDDDEMELQGDEQVRAVP